MPFARATMQRLRATESTETAMSATALGFAKLAHHNHRNDGGLQAWHI
jgi:hypothetical protein